MWWQYFLVLSGAFLVDVVPFPLPPAFTVMIFLQIVYGLNIWEVIIIGVAGSVAGRYILTLYIPRLAGKIFKRAKNEDVQFLGDRMKVKGWKSQLFIMIYSLMPLPSTPLFIAGGMAKMKPYYIIPAFMIGKFISDMLAVMAGKYAVENSTGLLSGMFTWQSITGLLLGLILIFILLFINWRTFLRGKKITFRFKILK